MTAVAEIMSPAEMLAALPEAERIKVIDEFTDSELAALEYDWRFWARPKQLAPEGDWLVWVIRAGRGFGKTRAGSGWVHERAMEHPGRWMAFVARTPADARDYMIEGPGGILRNTPVAERPHYEPSKRRLTWPNGSWATIYSDDEPDQIRGFSGDTAWLDEFAKYKNAQEVWDNLQFGMREVSSDRPRVLITTTPRPIATLIEIEAMDDTVVVVGSSYENRANLDPRWFDRILKRYAGTRLGRQEIDAEIIGDVPGALWKREQIERCRVVKIPELRRVVVAVDPAATSGEDAAETGITVGGIGLCPCKGKPELHGFLLSDESIRGTPQVWGSRAVVAYNKFKADRIVAETNNGGEMVEHVIRTIDSTVSYKSITASRGKQTRAEPVSALSEQGLIHHVGVFPDLEDQLCTWVPGEKSPDRLDSYVWLFTELMIEKKRRRTNVRVWYPGVDDEDNDET